MKVAEHSNFTLPELEAFQILMNTWLMLIPPTARTDVMKFVSRNLHELDIVQTLTPQLQEWLSNNNYRMKISQVSISDLRRVINLFYVGFCEYLGPISRQTLSGSAVKTKGQWQCFLFTVVSPLAVALIVMQQTC